MIKNNNDIVIYNNNNNNNNNNNVFIFIDRCNNLFLFQAFRPYRL